MPGDAPAGATLELDGVSKRFGAVTALADASLVAAPGRLTAIVGDNGAGKSTLVKCLTGVHQPDEGRILVDGSPQRFATPQDSRRVGIECVYQDLALADDLAVWQNLFLNREPRRWVGPLRLLDRPRMLRESRDMLASLDVAIPSVRSRVRRLSGGQRQAVAIARAAGWGSRVVLFDEPTAALGARETSRAEQLMGRLRDQGLCVLLVSHDFAQVQRLADQVVVMRSGRVTTTLDGEDVDATGLVELITGARE